MKRRITTEGFLNFFDDVLEVWVPLTRRGVYNRLHYPKIISWEDYFPSEIKRVANRLQRRGVVKVEQIGDELVVKITDQGKKEILKYKWADFKPKSGKWDGLWRMVFFDIAEKQRKSRDELRDFLKMLGMQQMQESVFVCPHDISGEVKYLREILGVPHAVKLAVLKWIENENELKEIFEL